MSPIRIVDENDAAGYSECSETDRLIDSMIRFDSILAFFLYDKYSANKSRDLMITVQISHVHVSRDSYIWTHSGVIQLALYFQVVTLTIFKPFWLYLMIDQSSFPDHFRNFLCHF